MYNFPPDPPATPARAAEASDGEIAAASAAEAALLGGSPTADAVADAVGALSVGGKDAVDTAALADGEGEKRVLTREEEIEEALACPCLDAMRDGSCGDVFIGAYRCFLESETEPQGMECVDAFGAMQGCMAQHPEEYGLDDDALDGGDVEVSAADAVGSADDVLGAVAAAERDDARADAAPVEAVEAEEAVDAVEAVEAVEEVEEVEEVADAAVGGDGEEASEGARDGAGEEPERGAPGAASA